MKKEQAVQTKQVRKSRLGLRFVTGYLAMNVVLFFVDPYASRWHYGSQNPAPIGVVTAADSDMSSSQIKKILDAIDLAYAARQPTQLEQVGRAGEKLTQLVFLPASFALVMKGFMAYLGPANAAQRVFTLSVKRRYNHLARLAISKGMQAEGFLFQEEHSLSKKNGQTFASLRTGASSSGQAIKAEKSAIPP